MRSVADRFRAVSSTQTPNSAPLFKSGTGAWTGNDSDVGSKRGSADGYPGRNDYSPRDGNYSGGQRSSKRNKTTEYENIKREKGSYFG